MTPINRLHDWVLIKAHSKGIAALCLLPDQFYLPSTKGIPKNQTAFPSFEEFSHFHVLAEDNTANF